MNPATRERIETTIQSKPVVLFMKGNKAMPQCGFSAQVVGILTRQNVDFLDIDVLADPELRQGLKEYSSWPTFPQLYIAGKLVGGADIVTNLSQSGELSRLLAAS